MKRRRRKVAKKPKRNVQERNPHEEHEQGKHKEKPQCYCGDCALEYLLSPDENKFKGFRPNIEILLAQSHIGYDHKRGHHEGKQRDDCIACLKERIPVECEEREIDVSTLSSNDIERMCSATQTLEDARGLSTLDDIVTVGKEFMLHGQVLEGGDSYFEPFQKMMNFHVIRRPFPAEHIAHYAAVEKARGQGLQIYIYWDRVAVMRTKLDERRAKDPPSEIHAPSETAEEESSRMSHSLRPLQDPSQGAQNAESDGTEANEIICELDLVDEFLYMNGKPFRTLWKDRAPHAFFKYMFGHQNRPVDYKALQVISGPDSAPLKAKSIRKFVDNAFSGEFKELKKVFWKRADTTGAFLHNPARKEDFEKHRIKKLPKGIPPYSRSKRA